MPDTPHSPHPGPMRVAVVGGGAFGRNHLRVYRELELANPHLIQLAALVEPDEQRRHLHAATYNIPTYATVAGLLKATAAGAPHLASEMWAGNKPHTLHAASICVPTLHHATVAAELLRANIDVLIEKPFATTLAEADHLIALAETHDRILAIGHLERFNPAVAATFAALNRPMFFEAHRLSIFTPRSLDVDVVLDLMIHDLDIVLALTQSAVREVRAVGLPVLSQKTDIANVRVEFESGCIANFTASRVSTEQVRKLRLFQPQQYLSLDFARQELLTIAVDPTMMPPANQSSRPERSAVERPAAPAAASHLQATTTAALKGTGFSPSIPTSTTGASAPEGHPTPGLNLTKSTLPKGEPLRLELEDFLNAVRHRTPPRVSAAAGRAALALALEINAAIATHTQRLKQVSRES